MISSWIAAFRLPVCVLGAIFSILGFKLAELELSWFVPLAIFFIGVSTMLQNDWRDRYHDIRKGRLLAFQYPQTFFRVLSISWMITWSLVLWVTADNVAVGTVLTLASCCGFIYSEVRLVPLAPIMLVSIVSGIPILLPVAIGGGSIKIWTLFFSTLLIIFGRELTKDIEDAKIDKGYKWTIPLVLGNEMAMAISLLMTISGFLLVGTVSYLFVFVLPVAVFGLFVFSKKGKTSRMRLLVDISMLLAIGIIFFFS